jgi:hypothetical protein
MPDSPERRTPNVAPRTARRIVAPGTAMRPAHRPSSIERAARIAFTFIVMNYSAVAGLVAALLGKKVWR